MSYKYFGRLVGSVSTGKQSLTESAPANTTTPFNPQQPATKFMAYGEDATSLAFNRALSALASNIDSLSSVLNAVTTKKSVISPLQMHADSHAGDAGFAGEAGWAKGSMALSDDPTLSATGLVVSGTTSLSLAGPGGMSPVSWVYVGRNSTELSVNVTFHRVAGQYGSDPVLTGQENLANITNPDEVDGLQTIYDTFHSVNPSNVYENSSEYNSGSGYAYHQPKYKDGAQAYLTDNPDTGIPLYVPPVKRVRTDLAPYNGNERYARISGWDSDGLYMKDYSADELYLRPGCYVEIVGDGSESAQAGNNGLFQIAEIIPADATAPTASGSKLILTRGGHHKVTVRDYTQFMEGELVSWRTSPYHQDSGDPTDPESSALNPALRNNFAHIGFIVPRPDLYSASKPDELPGDLYLKAASEASRFTTEDAFGNVGDWSRGVPTSMSDPSHNQRYSGQRTYGNVGLTDKEEDAQQNWNLLPGTFLFHGHAHLFPGDFGVGDWGMSAAVATVGFGSDILGPDDGVQDSVVSAGEPVVFSLEEYAGLVYPCAPSGFVLNPVFSLDPKKTLYSGAYQAHIKTLSTVREKLVSEVSPGYAFEGETLESGFDYADAQKLKGWQYFLRTGFDDASDYKTGDDKNFPSWGGGDYFRHPVSDGLNGPNSPTAQILGNSLWELRVKLVGGGSPTEDLTTSFESNPWGAFGDWVEFLHPDSYDTYDGVTPKPERKFLGKILSAVADPSDSTYGTVIVGSLGQGNPTHDHLSHDHLGITGSGGWPIQSSDQNSSMSLGGHSSGSLFENSTTGENWEVRSIVKAPAVSGVVNIMGVGKAAAPFIPSHGLNAAYHNHFSANPSLRLDPEASLQTLSGDISHSATGHIIHEHPERPVTLSLPGWANYEQALRVRTSSENVTLIRLDSNRDIYDDLTDSNKASSWHEARLGWYRTYTPIRKMEVTRDGSENLKIEYYSQGDRSAESFSLEEITWNAEGVTEGIPGYLKSSLSFGSENINTDPLWYAFDASWQMYDPDGYTLADAQAGATGTSPTQYGRRDVPLDSTHSHWAEDNFSRPPSYKQAVYNTRHTPQESQDRSIFGALEATVLGNYSFDAVNEATKKIHGSSSIEIGEALMSTEQQFGALSNGVITGGYCWAYMNEVSYGSDELVPPHLMKMHTQDKVQGHPGGFDTFANWMAEDAVASLRSVLFYDAYVTVGGTKWHVPSQMLDMDDYADNCEDEEFLIFFDARARRLLVKKKPTSSTIGESGAMGENAPWIAGDAWYYGLLEEAHVVPFAKVVMSGAQVFQVVNLRKPITRVDQRSHILVGVCNEFEQVLRNSGTAKMGQMKGDAYQNAQMHFRNMGEALTYLREMSKVQSHQTRQWTIEVVGTCYEQEDLARGITHPLRFPTHGLRIIGHKGTGPKFLKNPIGFGWGGSLSDSWPASDDELATASNLTKTATALVGESWYDEMGIHLGNQEDGSMVVWSNDKALFDLNSRQGVTVRDLHLEYRGENTDGLTAPGRYWKESWKGENCQPHIAAFICTREANDPTVPALDMDRSNAPGNGIYGDPSHSNTAFAGNYTFEGVTLHNGGILCDFYSHEYESTTKVSLDNIVLRNCRAINVTHGLAAFGCSQNVNVSEGHMGDSVDTSLASSLGSTWSISAGSWKKYHRGVLIEGCEATCVESGPHGLHNNHVIFDDGAGARSPSAVSKRRAGVFATHTKEITIRNCSFQGSFAYGVYLGEDVHWYTQGWAEEEQHWCTGTVTNCVINGAMDVGIYASSKHSFSDITLSSNTIREAGWPYWESTDSTSSGVRACEDPWAIFTDGNAVRILDNKIRSVVYANENFGKNSTLGDKDKSDEHLCGAIYAASRFGFFLETRPTVITGNSIRLVGKALNGIVLPDADWGMMTSSSSDTSIISNNTISNDITQSYHWSSSQYDFSSTSSFYDDVFDAADADFSTVGEDWPIALLVGSRHYSVRVSGNHLCGPVIFSGSNHNSIFSNNTVTDPQAVSALEGSKAFLPESVSDEAYPNASLMAVYNTVKISILGNHLDRGHLHMDDVSMSSITDNNLYGPEGAYSMEYTPQPLGIFMRSDCHQNNVESNMIPGSGFILIGATGDCYDNSIVNNKLGKPADLRLFSGWTVDTYTSQTDDPYLGKLETAIDGAPVATGSDVHTGGILYWNGGGGLISNNTLLNRDIYIGNYTYADNLDWDSYTHPDSGGWLPSTDSAHTMFAGTSFTVSGNRLNGGSIHAYAKGVTINGNDLTRYDINRHYSQRMIMGLNCYSPNIEICGEDATVTMNTVPGDIWSYYNHAGTISGNKVGGDIVAWNCAALVISDNNLNQSRKKQPDQAELISTGDLDWSDTCHATGLGNIVVQDCRAVRILNNTSLMGLEDYNQMRNYYLLGTKTDTSNHLTYADYVAPFTGRMGLDIWADMLTHVARHTSADYEGWLGDIEDYDSFDWNTMTAHGVLVALMLQDPTALHNAPGSSALGNLGSWLAAWTDLGYTAEDAENATMADFEALLNARDHSSYDGFNRIGGGSSQSFCKQPSPKLSSTPEGSEVDYYYKNDFGRGSNENASSAIGPFFPLNYQSTSGSLSAWNGITNEIDHKCSTYDQWGRRILVIDCVKPEVSGNTCSHVEFDHSPEGSIENNRLHWGGFNPSYVTENHSILVSGDVGYITVRNNDCSGSIWIRDNYYWGYESDQGQSYTYGSIQHGAEVSGNKVGNKAPIRQYATTMKMTFLEHENGASPTWDDEHKITTKTGGNTSDYYNLEFFYGGAGSIVIDNCTRLTAIGNDCDHPLGVATDRWNDQLYNGFEWGEIYINRLGNPMTKRTEDSSSPSGWKINAHPQNMQTVITSNKASGVMGYVRQPSGEDSLPYNGAGAVLEISRGNRVYAPHIQNAGDSTETDRMQLMDMVIPCIGASYGEWTGNRLMSDAFAYMTGQFGTDFSFQDAISAQWACKGAWLGSHTWWGNMDSWTGPAQANGEMTGSAVPTCTGAKWFGNPNYYLAKYNLQVEELDWFMMVWELNQNRDTDL